MTKKFYFFVLLPMLLVLGFGAVKIADACYYFGCIPSYNLGGYVVTAPVPTVHPAFSNPYFIPSYNSGNNNCCYWGNYNYGNNSSYNNSSYYGYGNTYSNNTYGNSASYAATPQPAQNNVNPYYNNYNYGYSGLGGNNYNNWNNGYNTNYNYWPYR